MKVSLGNCRINCFSPLLVEKALKELKKYSNKKTLVYPNSGEKYNPKDKYWSGKMNLIT
ncbi:homocysteine S-methyltransferase family protein [Flavobacteriaceae bacterium]|nr:homocysteine S-methyltransferase family protein [Flavobacteriaceae bacterium]